jgi:uncharacterized protein (DUF169 family)
MSIADVATRLQEALGLTSPPVAIAFRSEPPAGVPHVPQSLAAGCAYWSHAAAGHSFYTTADDHYGCPVGAHTHGITLPAERAGELQSVVGTMISLHYLREQEVPGIPRRAAPFGVAVYAPLREATFEPDLVLVRGIPRQLMVLVEAARAAQAFDDAPTMGRPACAMLPHVDGTALGVASLGCIGNRVYTGLGDDEMYVTLPGRRVLDLVNQLEVMVHANRALEQFHCDRRAAAGSSQGSA